MDERKKVIGEIKEIDEARQRFAYEIGKRLYLLRERFGEDIFARIIETYFPEITAEEAREYIRSAAQ